MVSASAAQPTVLRIRELLSLDGANVRGPDEPTMTLSFICRSSALRHTPDVRVLVVEDEHRMADVIRRSLLREGFAIDVSHDGESALLMASAVDYDAIVLDVMLPGRSGFDVCQLMRERGVWAPVLMLTARDAVRDRVAGLDSGADDYLLKPFALAELLARLRSLTRRGRPERPAIISVGDLTLDPAARQVHRGGDPIDLSAKEFALLEALMRRRGEVLTRLELIEQAWDLAYEVRSNVIDVYMRRLRRKLDEPYGVRTLETVRGVGYRLKAP
jgi:two-component system OmpR family response regulator